MFDYIFYAVIFSSFGFLVKMFMDRKVIKNAKENIKYVDMLQSKAYRKGYRTGISGRK